MSQTTQTVKNVYLDGLIVAAPLDGGHRVANHLDGDVPLVTHRQALDLELLIILKPWSLCSQNKPASSLSLSYCDYEVKCLGLCLRV